MKIDLNTPPKDTMQLLKQALFEIAILEKMWDSAIKKIESNPQK